MTTVQKRPAIDARTLISADLRATLAANMRDKFPELTGEKAERGVGQMLAFVAASTYSDKPLSPSHLVDDFWHAFLLHTKAYQDFCEQTFGAFVHHQPGTPPSRPRRSPTRFPRTGTPTRPTSRPSRTRCSPPGRAGSGQTRCRTGPR